MSRFIAPPIAPMAGATALVAWTIALAQALPRLMAGPLCSARQDMGVIAGHCPACFVAVTLTLAWLALLVPGRRTVAKAR